eukprot:TRINITY_DN1913_c0_g1_i2.p1 TRINITY_DN1913_c0_g1~~TRINITY_DN1913_c0_g1_i2.p1  ORF type:complete len:339 (+),score=67.40 TRINITY_DN1913_c0_g1_i2:2-1018(+)
MRPTVGGGVSAQMLQQQQQQQQQLMMMMQQASMQQAPVPASAAAAAGGGRGGYSYGSLGGNRAPKVFIGQVPRQYSEADLRPLFAPYGNILELVVIRNRATGESRGCAFLTFSDKSESDAAIAAVHNSRALPGMNHPIQVKYSDSNEPSVVAREFKLFVGKLPMTTAEDEVRQLFAPYGRITEVVILHDFDGSSKGCAFVKYGSMAEAEAAIANLHGKVKLPGGPCELVVKYADNKKEPRTAYGGGAGGGGRYDGGYSGSSGYGTYDSAQSAARPVANPPQPDYGGGYGGGPNATMSQANLLNALSTLQSLLFPGGQAPYGGMPYLPVAAPLDYVRKR